MTNDSRTSTVKQVRIDAGDEEVDGIVAPRSLGRVRCQVDAEPEPLRQAQHGEPADLAAGAAEHSLGDAIEQSGAHRKVHEIVGSDNGAIRLHPPGQQLGTNDHAGAGVELRLEERDDVAIVDGSSKPQLEIDPVAVLTRQVGVEVGDPAATGRLRPIERDVGVRQDFADVGHRGSGRGRFRC